MSTLRIHLSHFGFQTEGRDKDQNRGAVCGVMSQDIAESISACVRV